VRRAAVRPHQTREEEVQTQAELLARFGMWPVPGLGKHRDDDDEAMMASSVMGKWYLHCLRAVAVFATSFLAELGRMSSMWYLFFIFGMEG
jgi:hypothetical protein